MKQPLCRVHCSLLAIVAGLCITTPAAVALPFQQMIVFGDSLSDTGNDFIATSGLIPPPVAYGNGRFTDGTDSLPKYFNPGSLARATFSQAGPSGSRAISRGWN